MNRYSWLEGYLLSMPGAVTDYKLEWQWQRYLVGGRMFAAVCTPGPEHAAHAGRYPALLGPVFSVDLAYLAGRGAD